MAAFGEALAASFTHLLAGGGTFLYLLGSNRTVLSSGSSAPGWGIPSHPITAHEEQTGNEIKAHVHLQQPEQAKPFCLQKGLLQTDGFFQY